GQQGRGRATRTTAACPTRPCDQRDCDAADLWNDLWQNYVQPNSYKFVGSNTQFYYDWLHCRGPSGDICAEMAMAQKLLNDYQQVKAAYDKVLGEINNNGAQYNTTDAQNQVDRTLQPPTPLT